MVAKVAMDNYELHTPLEERTIVGVQSTIVEEFCKVSKEHDSKFKRNLAIANPKLGPKFLAHIKKHYNKQDELEMSQE